MVAEIDRSREPIRNETLDNFGQSEKLKCSLASPNHLLSVYDSRLEKIKIYDFRYLTVNSLRSCRIFCNNDFR